MTRTEHKIRTMWLSGKGTMEIAKDLDMAPTKVQRAIQKMHLPKRKK